MQTANQTATVMLGPFSVCSSPLPQQHAHAGSGGLLVSCGHGPPLLPSAPQPLDKVAVGVGPIRAGKPFLVALGRDRRASACIPDMLAEGMGRVAPGRPRSTAAYQANNPADPVPAGVHAPDRARAQTRWHDQRHRRSRRPWCHSPHESAQALHVKPCTSNGGQTHLARCSSRTAGTSCRDRGGLALPL